MDFEGSKKDDIKPSSSSNKKEEKEKIDVTVNVNINGVSGKSNGKKKSKVSIKKNHQETNHKRNGTVGSMKTKEEPADKRSIVHANKPSLKSEVKINKNEDEEQDDDEEDDEDDGKASERRHEGTAAKSLKVSSTLSHLKDVKAPPALMNQLKKKIQQQESEANEEGDDDDDDDDNDDEEEMSGSGSSSNKEQTVTGTHQVGIDAAGGEDAEKFGNNVHPSLKNSSLSAGKTKQLLYFHQIYEHTHFHCP